MIPALLSQQQLPEPTVPLSAINLVLTRTSQALDGWESSTILSHQIPLDTNSAQFWDAPLKTPSVSRVEINGEEIISISPGPDDHVKVIVQLKTDPVAVVKGRTRQRPSGDATTAAQTIQDHQQLVVDSHTAALKAMATQQLPFEPKYYYSYLFNGIAGSIRMADLPALAERPQVEHVYLDYQVHVTLGDSVPLIGAPEMWLPRPSLQGYRRL